MRTEIREVSLSRDQTIVLGRDLEREQRGQDIGGVNRSGCVRQKSVADQSADGILQRPRAVLLGVALIQDKPYDVFACAENAAEMSALQRKFRSQESTAQSELRVVRQTDKNNLRTETL